VAVNKNVNLFSNNLKRRAMKYYVVCNWKMNPSSFDKAKGLIDCYNKTLRSRKSKNGNTVKLIVFPPFVYFQLIDERRSKAIELGAQDIFWKGSGPYTGKISASMVKEIGAQFVIVGHSSLRRLGDSEEVVNMKIREALKKNLTPIVFVGTYDYAKETRSVSSNFSAEEINKMIFTYEPVEAVGTLNPAPSDKVARAIREIKKIIYKRFRRKNFWGLVSLGGRKYLIPKPMILYGGSIDPNNCETYLHDTDVGGFVIGRESLKPKSIEKIIEKIENY